VVEAATMAAVEVAEDNDDKQDDRQAITCAQWATKTKRNNKL
jgi:hypothetical protein